MYFLFRKAEYPFSFFFLLCQVTVFFLSSTPSRCRRRHCRRRAFLLQSTTLSIPLNLTRSTF